MKVSGTDVMPSGARWMDTARQATTYRTGRGRAHVYAPVGGQGLDVGIVDAANLGAVICGWVGEDILDTYTDERHPTSTPHRMHGPGGRRRVAQPGRRLCRPGRTPTPPRGCVRWAHGSANRPEHRINSRLRFAQ